MTRTDLLIGAIVSLGCCSAAVVSAQGAHVGRSVTSAQIGSASPSPAWTPTRIEVFAMTDTAIANAARAVVHRVDARDRLIAELNAVNLPPNQQQALAIVRRRIHDMGPRFHSEVHAALRAIEAVAVYGVERVPAVVLDSSRVVYGVTDVAQAIEVVRRGGGQPIRQRFVPGAAEGRSGPTHAPARRRAP